MKKVSILAIALLAVATQAVALEPIFMPLKLDGPVHDPANKTYWYGPFSEGNAVLDMDGDGDPDISCGNNWYENPGWAKHEDFRTGARTNGEFVNNNGEFAVDVNRDGRMDIISSGWFDDGVFWYENPGKPGVEWKATKIVASKSTEGLLVADIDADGDMDVLVNHWANEPGQGVTWLELQNDRAGFRVHNLGIKGDRHGGGVGDINGDGRPDIVTPDGWYEGPKTAATDTWAFHTDFALPGHPNAEPSIPILVMDVNEDGMNDLVWGDGHGYGLHCLEQTKSGPWKDNLIEDSYGQFHPFTVADVNADGRPDIVTGKRLRGHNGGDKSSFDPLFVFWYEVKGGEFTRHVLSLNHVPWFKGMEWSSIAPNAAIGAGVNITVRDLTGDGLVDIVCSGKSGLYLFVNRGLPPTDKLD